KPETRCRSASTGSPSTPVPAVGRPQRSRPRRRTSDLGRGSGPGRTAGEPRKRYRGDLAVRRLAHADDDDRIGPGDPAARIPGGARLEDPVPGGTGSGESAAHPRGLPRLFAGRCGTPPVLPGRPARLLPAMEGGTRTPGRTGCR